MRRLGVLVLVCCALGAVGAANAAVADDEVLVRVNGTEITSADLELQLVLFSPERRDDPAVRATVLQQLIDRALLASFLDEQEVEVDADAVEARVERLQRVMEARGLVLEEVLKQFGRTLESLRAEQAMPVRWNSYVRRVVAQDQISDYFDAHRTELDGTKVHLYHIALTIAADEPMSAWDEAQVRLQGIRDEIVSGGITFADAARMHSEAPSAEQGGDIGFINFRGDVAIEVARAAFEREVGEISEPIRSPFGMHLVQVVDRQPGQLSLEDVREDIIKLLGEELKLAEIVRLTESATIERLTDAP